MLCPCARTVPLFSKHQLLLGLAFAFVQATGALAADPTSDKNAIFAAAKDAIAHGEVDKTYLEGFAIKKTSFEELLPEGAVLIGFDIGLGPFVKDDVIYALRPIYLTAKGEIKGRDVGKLTTGRPQDKVKRVIQIKAKPGYAVAKIRMQHGLGIECLRFTFEELTANGLDSERSYSSGWIGTYHPEREEKVLSGEGGPILGIFGNKDDKQVLALGLIHFPDLTAPPMPPVKERVKATAPEETKQAEPAGNNVEEPAPKEEALPEATSGSLSWLPFVVFGVVAIPAFLVLMLVLGKKKQVVSDQPPRRNRVRKVPPAKTEINDNLQADDSDIPMVLPVDDANVAPKLPAPENPPLPPNIEEYPPPLPVAKENPPPLPNIEETPPPLPVVEETPSLPRNIEEYPPPLPVAKENPPPLPNIEETPLPLLVSAETRPPLPTSNGNVPPKLAAEEDAPRMLAAEENVNARRKSAAPPKEEIAMVGPADPNDPYWNSSELMAKATGASGPSSSTAAISMFIGVVGLFLWCIPILGGPLSVAGLVFGIIGLKSPRPDKAVLGIGLNALGLIFTIINVAISAYLVTKGHHPSMR